MMIAPVRRVFDLDSQICGLGLLGIPHKKKNAPISLPHRWCGNEKNITTYIFFIYSVAIGDKTLSP